MDSAFAEYLGKQLIILMAVIFIAGSMVGVVYWYSMDLAPYSYWLPIVEEI
jgi:hypothetical protein